MQGQRKRGIFSHHKKYIKKWVSVEFFGLNTAQELEKVSISYL